MKCPLRVGLLSPGRSNCHCIINNSLGLINAALPKAQDSKRLKNVYFTRSVQNIRHYDIDTNKNMILPVLSIRITIAEVLVATNNQWMDIFKLFTSMLPLFLYLTRFNPLFPWASRSLICQKIEIS